MQGGAKKSKKKKKTDDREIEWRWMDIDIDKFRKNLKKHKALLVYPKTIMPLMVFSHPTGKKDSYIRIRNEGDHITLTSKTNLGNNYVTEYEVIIDNFEQGIKILKSIGCEKKYYIEKLRETWKLPGTKEIVIDSYPGTDEYVEIDAYSEKDLRAVTKLFGLSEPTFPLPSVDDIYERLYGMTKGSNKSGDLTFKDAYKILKKFIKKNVSMFKKIIKDQQKYYTTLDFDTSIIK